MKTSKIMTALAFTFTSLATLPAGASTLSVQHCDGGDIDADVLSDNAYHNRNLTVGDYAFAGMHNTYGSSFLDEWKFTLADDSNVSISVFDLDVPTTGSGNKTLSAYGYKWENHGSYGHSHHHHNNWQPASNYLFDNQYLTFSLFDQEGNLLGTAGEDGTLSVADLSAGQWYTVTVSAKVNGLFGSAYHGNLSVQPVPLGDSLPLFGSALALLALRRRSRNRTPQH